MNRRSFTTFVLSAVGGLARSAQAEPPEPVADGTGLPNAVLPTWGGKQFWGDELFFHGWHIQRNAITGHYRLLDERNLRHAGARWPTAKAGWPKFAAATSCLPCKGRPSWCCTAWAVARRRWPAWPSFSRQPENIACSTSPIRPRGARSASTPNRSSGYIGSLDGVDKIHFVAHSLGNLVIRHYLGDQQQVEAAETRLGRIVMLGPPDNGARLAEVFGQTGWFQFLLGKSAVEIRDFRRTFSRGSPRPPSSPLFPAGAAARGATTLGLRATTTWWWTWKAPGWRAQRFRPAAGPAHPDDGRSHGPSVHAAVLRARIFRLGGRARPIARGSG